MVPFKNNKKEAFKSREVSFRVVSVLKGGCHSHLLQDGLPLLFKETISLGYECFAKQTQTDSGCSTNTPRPWWCCRWRRWVSKIRHFLIKAMEHGKDKSQNPIKSI
jgi:hypothetical protein